MTNNAISALAGELDQKDPKDIIAHALKQYGRCAISFSGAEDVLLVHFGVKVLGAGSDLSVFSLDTGRLHPETYQFIDKVREHYKVDIEVLYPEPEPLQELVRNKGLFSFYQDGHGECCGIRKIAPLRKKLHTLDAWITGQRRDQSPSTRQDVAVVESDAANSAPETELVKFNPLSHWSSKQVWDYIRSFDIPYNPLHDQGYVSIGCAPCTRSVSPNEHERAGRWWWEEATAKECGLHNTKSE